MPDKENKIKRNVTHTVNATVTIDKAPENVDIKESNKGTILWEVPKHSLDEIMEKLSLDDKYTYETFENEIEYTDNCMYRLVTSTNLFSGACQFFSKVYSPIFTSKENQTIDRVMDFGVDTDEKWGEYFKIHEIYHAGKPFNPILNTILIPLKAIRNYILRDLEIYINTIEDDKFLTHFSTQRDLSDNSEHKERASSLNEARENILASISEIGILLKPFNKAISDNYTIEFKNDNSDDNVKKAKPINHLEYAGVVDAAEVELNALTVVLNTYATYLADFVTRVGLDYINTLDINEQLNNLVNKHKEIINEELSCKRVTPSSGLVEAFGTLRDNINGTRLYMDYLSALSGLLCEQYEGPINSPIEIKVFNCITDISNMIKIVGERIESAKDVKDTCLNKIER